MKPLVIVFSLCTAAGAAITAFDDDVPYLRDAQKHPEKYRNLQVRVCDWNVRWNSLSRWEQEHFLALAQEGR